MTITMTGPGPTRDAADPANGTGLLRRSEPKPRRRIARILVGVALLAVCGLAAVFVTEQVQTQNRVVIVRGDVSRGEVVEAGDLAEVTVGSVQGVSTVPATDLPQLVGQRALIDLGDGALLPQGAVGPAAVPPPGETLVGLRLEQGRMAVGDVAPGSKVRLIVTAPQGGDVSFKDKNSNRQFPATLINSTVALDGAASLINVQVAQADARLIAQLAATSRLAVVQDPQA